MANDKAEPKKVEEKVTSVTGFYKGYDIRWLKKEPQHPDFKLVAEYEAKNGEIK